MRHERGLPEGNSSGILAELTDGATGLGRATVEIGAFLADLDQQCRAQTTDLEAVQTAVDALGHATSGMGQAMAQMRTHAEEALGGVQHSSEVIARSAGASQDIAQWVRSVHGDGEAVEGFLRAVQQSNAQIADIASQVTILAVNAKIEAARAGQAGKGFGIVADSVNELSMKTAQAAGQITETVKQLTDWMRGLHRGAEANVRGAQAVLDGAAQTDAALRRIETQVEALSEEATRVEAETSRATACMEQVRPAVQSIATSVSGVAVGVEQANRRCERLVDTSEGLLQQAVALGGNGADAPMITRVQDIAGQIAEAFESAVASGRITLNALFDTRYVPIPGTDPVQVRTAFTDLTDALLPAIQEPAAASDRGVVFCAAVDRNGYLPTHNRKFSQPQSDDPVWNAANCRNRRIFDDRVGLKAGRNQRPFLLQVYRRDMGGGAFVMMKDLSAPIHVQGRHWGGVRLAYKI
ncbi:methyl-accepting chemotaxis protein [Cognatishimia sp. F0-27]|uniref:methyl-accepting chemotaxis protein n=1 Tax=Cognatishimia sp. F0-27 TaxID=2816855 RepID=UPI001D0C506E|nr:methyl-accepting chemotaxis protein [Cognatishimia sp. F0-27]MCC1493393.1 methyl-accepting chemotaxis protein [Cognatishimia sp. F0-27]